MTVGTPAYRAVTELDWPPSVLTLNGTAAGSTVCVCGGAMIWISVPVTNT